MTPEEKEQNYKLAAQLLSEQNFGPAVIGGVIAMILSAGIYAVITVAMGYATAFLAIGIGVTVGFSIQYLGRGIETKFVVVAAVLAVVGCILGNIFADFQLLDLLFWPLAIYAATFFAKRPLNREEGLAIHTSR